MYEDFAIYLLKLNDQKVDNRNPGKKYKPKRNLLQTGDDSTARSKT